jgi:hypothetical protein
MADVACGLPMTYGCGELLACTTLAGYIDADSPCFLDSPRGWVKAGRWKTSLPVRCRILMLTCTSDLIQLRQPTVLLLRLSAIMEEEGTLRKAMAPCRAAVLLIVTCPPYYPCFLSGSNS